MAWNNNNKGGGKSYSNNNRSQSNNRNNNSGGNDKPKKHSGATKGIYDSPSMGKGQPYVRGWNASKQFGLRTFLCSRYEGTKKVTSDSGKEWENWIVKIQTKGGKDETTSGMYEVATGRVVIKELGFVINPKAPNGGYCGRYA